jgi:hypothetical protein
VADAQSGPVVSVNGLYLSVDGGWERVALPPYALGFRNSVGFIDRGVAQPFTQRYDGSNIRGTIGYYITPNVRAEFDARFTKAKNSQSGTATVASIGVLSLLNGTTSPFGAGVPCFTPCSAASRLSTNYSNWQINGKVAADNRIGPVTLTPSVAIFGGHALVDQNLAQSLGIGLTYNASTSLGWTDVGGRLGINADLDVNPWLTVGLGGNVGVARRYVSLTGSDVGVGAVFAGTSAVSGIANTNARVANVETQATIKWSRVALRAFAGLNYDNRVPGISSPAYVNPVVSPGLPIVPAGIAFATQTSYYAGGRLSYQFN